MLECVCLQSVTKVWWFVKDRSTAVSVSGCTESCQQETRHSYKHRPGTEGFLHAKSVTQHARHWNANSCNAVTRPYTKAGSKDANRPISIETPRSQQRVIDGQFTEPAKTSQSSRLLLMCISHMNWPLHCCLVYYVNVHPVCYLYRESVNHYFCVSVLRPVHSKKNF